MLKECHKKHQYAEFLAFWHRIHSCTELIPMFVFQGLLEIMPKWKKLDPKLKDEMVLVSVGHYHQNATLLQLHLDDLETYSKEVRAEAARKEVRAETAAALSVATAAAKGLAEVRAENVELRAKFDDLVSQVRVLLAASNP